MPPYPIRTVANDAAEATEQLGTKHKFWYGDRRYLFKEGRANTGENWAECVVADIAELLGLPHALYELAIWNGHKGVVTENFVPRDGRLVLGNEVLSTSIREYDSTKRRGQSGHTIRAVMAVLRKPTIAPPHGWARTDGLSQAPDVFLGYLLLDALVGNTDRHHENWGWISFPGREIRLTPTFDHASSLGRELTDERRILALKGTDRQASLERYAARGRSALFRHPTDQRPLSQIDAFYDGARLYPAAGRAWLKRLECIDENALCAFRCKIPVDWGSEYATEFAARLICYNRAEILRRRGELS